MLHVAKSHDFQGGKEIPSFSSKRKDSDILLLYFVCERFFKHTHIRIPKHHYSMLVRNSRRKDGEEYAESETLFSIS